MTPFRPRVASTDAGVALRGVVQPEDAVALAALAIRVGDPRPDAPLSCDVSALDRPGLAALDTLARIALSCRQRGTSVVVTGAPDSLRALMAFGGLGAYVALAGPAEREDEGREAAPPSRRGAAAGQTAGRSAPCRGRT